MSTVASLHPVTVACPPAIGVIPTAVPTETAMREVNR